MMRRRSFRRGRSHKGFGSRRSFSGRRFSGSEVGIVPLICLGMDHLEEV